MATTDSTLFGKALADETRQKIMALICCQRLSVTEIVEKLNVTQPTVSHHLAILRDAGLVRVQEDGRQTFYTLNQEQFESCCNILVLKLAPQTETAKAVKMFKIVVDKE